ncbi:hypothetical protein ALC60_00217, partial [Trachymyrmex zeteki]
FNVIKDDRYWAKKIAEKRECPSMCITIPAGSEKCVELLIIDNIWTEYCDRGKIPFLDMCDEHCYKCEKCDFALTYNSKLLDDCLNLRINRYCNAYERFTCKCSVEECDVCFAWLQRCDECIERLEELCRAKRPRLVVEHRQSVVARIARLAGAKTQLERRFVHVGGEYASGNDRSLVWREIDTAFESRVLTVLKRVRDVVERHGSVKVNTAFNGEFATNDKRTIKSINTKNSEIYRYSDLREWYERHVIEPTLT